MTFVVLAVLLTMFGLFFIVMPLLSKQQQTSSDQREQLNRSIYLAKVDELDADLDKGSLDQDEYQLALNDLQKTLIDDVDDTQFLPFESRRSWLLIAFVVVAFSGSSFYLYQDISTFETDQQTQQRLEASQMKSIEAAITGLESRLQDDPQDLDGWKMLGQTYSTIENFQLARDTYLKALQYFGGDPDLLVLAAEASAFSNDELFTEYEISLLKRALAVDPRHERGLWYSGYSAFLNQNYQESVQYWTLLLDQVPDSRPEVKQSLGQFLTDARERAGLPAQTIPQQALPRKISVRVSISESLLNTLRGDETLFVYAKAVAGPPMPLALVRLTARDLPVTVTLNEDTSMMPNMTLKNADQVHVLARVSSSGQAIPQPGDLLSDAQLVDFSEQAQSEIDLNIHQKN
jgi:cytochrome c-type biogenesis protein CcmH